MLVEGHKTKVMRLSKANTATSSGNVGTRREVGLASAWASSERGLATLQTWTDAD